MSKRIVFAISLVAVLIFSSAALAQGPVGPTHSDPTWQASYWRNMGLSGNPVLERQDTDINFDWGVGSPDPAVPTDQFSARWTRYLYMQTAGAYRFTATSDDGVRVFVDDVQIINAWWDHGVRTYTADKVLSQGHHLVRVEFYENAGVAVCKFTWTQVIPITNWRGEYYNNVALSGSPVLVRDDAKINFNWAYGSPAQDVVNPEQFSVRWTRSISLPAGSYRFSMTIDDGGRLWVNNHLLIDQWSDHDGLTFTGDIYLPGGNIAIKMEYYENYGEAEVRLTWSTEAGPGTVIVDDKDPGFKKGGSATSWRIVYEGYNGRLYWTKNNDYSHRNYNWARWYPNLSAGRYEVFVYIPDRYSTTSKARYWISHADGFTLRIVDQSAHGGTWVSLGTYQFRGQHSEYVSLADVTYEPYLSRLIAFDAVKWEPR